MRQSVSTVSEELRNLPKQNHVEIHRILTFYLNRRTCVFLGGKCRVCTGPVRVTKGGYGGAAAEGDGEADPV